MTPLRLLTALSVTAGLAVGAAYGVEHVLPARGCALAVGGEEQRLEPAQARRLTTLAATPVSQRGPLSAEDRAAVRAVRRGEAALTCTVPSPGGEAQAEGPNGLTPRAERLRGAMREAFGRQSLGGFAPGGVDGGHVEGSAHYDGRAIDVFFRPVGAPQRRAGWTLAHWLVAHAEPLGVATVIYDDRIWTARRSGQGWRDYEHPSGDTSNDVLQHRDHVHVDVA